MRNQLFDAWKNSSRRRTGQFELFTIALVCVVVLFSEVAQARVVRIEYEFPNEPSKSIHGWSFDDESQVLRIYDTLFEFGFDQGKITGVIDSESTFTVKRTIVNMTDVTWTSATLIDGAGIGGGGVIVDGSASSTKLGTITYPSFARVKFSGPPAVLPGESFTFELDFFVPYIPSEPGFQNAFNFDPIPEPATLLSVGVGALVLFRRRKAQNRW
jgi:hypothetical protein